MAPSEYPTHYSVVTDFRDNLTKYYAKEWCVEVSKDFKFRGFFRHWYKFEI